MKSYYSLDIKKPSQKKNKAVFTALAFFCALLVSSIYFILFNYNSDNLLFKVEKGQSLASVSKKAEEINLIPSSVALRAYMQLRSMQVKSGTYLFDGKQNLFNIAKRLSSADYGDVYVSVTVPEGSSLNQIADIFDKKEGINFDKFLFLTESKGKEGYLFPDTYSLLPESDTIDIIALMENQFLLKEKELGLDLLSDIEKNKIVILASIIEKEAQNDLVQKQMIADVLYKRISKGIPLQVDAPFLYERGKGSFDLSRADLQKNSAYNTYTNLGLTPTAIGSPGFDSLYSALNPISNPYYFYLHGKDANIYYGKNHSEHVRNKRMYLR